MGQTPENIFPVFDQLLQREDKERMLKQRARVVWLTGLSGSGKTTVAKALERKLHEAGYLTQLLDGDNIRAGINNNLGFSEADRTENIRRISEVSKLFLNCGIITLNCFVSPTTAIRAMARDLIGAEDYIEVFVHAPLEVCEDRDVKGLYAKARAGDIKNFTGIDAPYEAPESPDLTLETGSEALEESAQKLFDYLLPHIQIPT